MHPHVVRKAEQLFLLVGRQTQADDLPLNCDAFEPRFRKQLAQVATAIVEASGDDKQAPTLVLEGIE